MLRGEFELNGGADFHADSLPALLAEGERSPWLSSSTSATSTASIPGAVSPASSRYACPRRCMPKPRPPRLRVASASTSLWPKRSRTKPRQRHSLEPRLDRLRRPRRLRTRAQRDPAARRAGCARTTRSPLSGRFSCLRPPVGKRIALFGLSRGEEHERTAPHHRQSGPTRRQAMP